MKRSFEKHMTSREKNLVAMGAAIGAGCRVCTDSLYESAVSMNLPQYDVMKSLFAALDSKMQSAKTMKDKISELINSDKSDSRKNTPISAMLISLVKIASLTAANSAPDVILEIDRARAKGATHDQIQICVALGRMVRKNSYFYSDREIERHLVRISDSGSVSHVTQNI